MNTELFRKYLELNRYSKNTINSRISNCETIERYYKDLDILYQENQLTPLLEELVYTTDDERNNAPVLHKIPIDGNLRTGTSTLKSALKLYKDFKEQESELIIESNNTGFKYEADLENAIYHQASQLFPAYDVINKQYKVGENKNRIIDILLSHKEDKSFLVVEIKAGEIDRDAFGQISEYIMLLQKEHPDRVIKGCLVGYAFADNIEDILQSSKYEISLKKYTLKVELEHIL